MSFSEEFSGLFRLDELKALGISDLDLWSLLPEELDSLKALKQTGIQTVVDTLRSEIGEIADAIASELSKRLGNVIGLAAGFFLPGIGAVLGPIIGSFLGGILGDLFGPDRIPKDKLAEAGLAYRRHIIYIPPGAAKKNVYGVFPPEFRGGTVFSQTADQAEDEVFFFRALGNVICSKSEPHVPVMRFVRFGKDDKPVLSTCIGFTAEGYALFDEWPGSERYIGAVVDKGGIPYATAHSAGVPAWGIERARTSALVAHAVGLPGGFHGPLGFAGTVFRFKRRVSAMIKSIKAGTSPLKVAVFRWDFWKWIPGFARLRSGGLRGEPEGPSYYSFSMDMLKNDVRGWFFTDSSREDPGRIKWISVGIAALFPLLLVWRLLRRKK